MLALWVTDCLLHIISSSLLLLMPILLLRPLAHLLRPHQSLNHLRHPLRLLPTRLLILRIRQRIQSSEKPQLLQISNQRAQVLRSLDQSRTLLSDRQLLLRTRVVILRFANLRDGGVLACVGGSDGAQDGGEIAFAAIGVGIALVEDGVAEGFSAGYVEGNCVSCASVIKFW